MVVLQSLCSILRVGGSKAPFDSLAKRHVIGRNGVGIYGGDFRPGPGLLRDASVSLARPFSLHILSHLSILLLSQHENNSQDTSAKSVPGQLTYIRIPDS